MKKQGIVDLGGVFETLVIVGMRLWWGPRTTKALIDLAVNKFCEFWVILSTFLQAERVLFYQ